MKNVLVYGGKGALGQAIVKKFNSMRWTTISLDFTANKNASKNITPNSTDNFLEQSDFISNEIKLALKNQKLDAVITVAGGWSGGNVKSDDFLKNLNLMIQQSVHTSAIGAKIAADYLKDDGFLLLTGAEGALKPTPQMIAYGMAKASVHHLVSSLSSKDCGLPENSSTVAILPTVIDTPNNRSAMPNANFKNWTSLEELSDQIANWSEGRNRPKNGSLVKIETYEGKTTYEELEK
eukprot:gene1620-12745_t